MCGIAGYAGGFIPGLVARMNGLQAHRGPDGRGTFEDAAAEVALAHTRLAILDLSEHARQPMADPSGRFVLVYNGEIYNFAELRRALGEDPSSYGSTGDTEVLLRGLARHGAEFLERVNGMFALALWDRRERALLVARDPLGIKPLYCAEPRPGTLLFASEIKALCAHPDLARAPDFEVLQQHLAFGHAAGERTVLRGVRRLPPGTTRLWRAGRGSSPPSCFWTPRYGTRSARDRPAAAAELRTAIREATGRQLVSDVPVGAFLSGGLDSSLVTACAAAAADGSLQCYTVSYPASENVLDRFADDAPYARSLARALGLRHQEIEIRAEVAALLPELVYHLDEPLADPAAITAYLISREASDRGSTVLLSGQGADELFGGYPRYQAMQATRALQRLPRPLRRGLAGAAGLLPGSRGGSAGAALRRARRVLSGLRHDPDERFLGYCAATPAEQIRRVLSAEVRAELADRRPADECRQRMQEGGLQGLDRYLARDLSSYLPNHNLAYMDRMGMAVGVEVRVPLLDQEIVDLVTPMPAGWKVDGTRSKAILRQAARGIVEPAIIERPKAGFGAPYRKWLRYDLDGMWREVASESATRRRGWFDHRNLEEARRRSRSGRDDLYMLQWAVLTAELWARAFLDLNPAARSRSEEAPAPPVTALG